VGPYPFDEPNHVLIKTSLCRLEFVTPSVRTLRFLCTEGLYIGLSGWLGSQLWGLVGGSTLSFWSALGERKRGES
jgi:hypothetical protein